MLYYLCHQIKKTFLNIKDSTYLSGKFGFYYSLDSLNNNESCIIGLDRIYLTESEIKHYQSSTNDNNTHIGTRRPFTLEGDDGIFALLLICFVFFTRIYKLGFSFFKENMRVFLFPRKRQSTFNETTSTEFWFNFILVFQSILLASIILFDYFLETNQSYTPSHSFYTIVLFIAVISLFLFLKFLIYKLIGILFNIKEAIGLWIKNYMLVLEMMGIIAFIPVLVLVYSQNYHDYLLVFFIFLFITSRLLLFYRLITFFLEQRVNFLFLIAYLCSVEIIPYIILYQVLIFLYKVDIIQLLWL